MGGRITNRIGKMIGLCIADTRIGYDGVSADESSYTQSGERPGTALGDDVRSRILPIVSGAQGADVLAEVGRAGYAETDPTRSGAIAVKSDGDWRGWNSSSVIARAGRMRASRVGSFELNDVCALQYGAFAQGRAIALNYEDRTNTAPRAYRLDVSAPTEYWDDLGAIRTPAASEYHWDSSITQLPDGRLLAIVLVEIASIGKGRWLMYMSDDDGETWAPYDDDPFRLNGDLPDRLAFAGSGAFDVTRCKLRAMPDGSVVFVRWSEATPGSLSRQFTQYASSGLGSSFVWVCDWTVADPGNVPVFDFDLSVTPAGTLVFARTSAGTDTSVNPDTGGVYTRTVSGAFAPLAAATEQTLDMPGRWRTCALATSPNGLTTLAYSASGFIQRTESYDEGRNWGVQRLSLGGYGGRIAQITTGSDAQFSDLSIGSLGSGLVCTYTTTGATGDTDNDGDPMWLQLGGWSNVEIAGGYASPDRIARDYLPADLPADLSASSWTQTGSGTEDITPEGALKLDATTSISYGGTITTSDTDVLAIGQMRRIIGGLTTMARIGARIETVAGGSRRRVLICEHASGFEVVDKQTSTVIASASFDSTDWHEWMVWISGLDGELFVAYRLHNEHDWTIVTDGEHLAADTATDATSYWGIVEDDGLGSTQACEWRRFTEVRSTSAGVGTLRPRYGVASDGATSPLRGMPMTTAPVYLLGAQTDDGASYLRVEGGPGRLGESWGIPREYDYPMRHAWAASSRSPARRWETLDGGAQELVFDLGYDSPLADGGSVYLYSDATGIAGVALDGWDGTDWVSITNSATSGGVTELKRYAITGDVVSPSAASENPGRLYNRNELAGAVVELTDGTNTVYRVIKSNSSGVWADPDSVKAATIRLVEVDGTEPSTGTLTATLHHPKALTIAHNVAPYDKYRVTVTPMGDTASIGVISVGSFCPFGQRPALSSSTSLATSTTSRRDRYGTAYIRQDGPPARTLTMQWSDPLDLFSMRKKDPSPPYISADTGGPLATYQDVPYWLHAAFAEMQSGSIPCVFVARVSGHTETITDPTIMLYGSLTRVGDMTLRLGQEGETEVIGVGSTTMEEIV